MVGFFLLAMRARIGKRSNPDDEYIGRPRGGGAESGVGHKEAWVLHPTTGGGTLAGRGLGDDGRGLGMDEFG